MCIKILYTTMWKTSNAVKTAWIIWCIALKTRTVFPCTKLNLNLVKFAFKSIFLAGDIEVFCRDYTNVVTLFMHEQQKKLDLSLFADC